MEPKESARPAGPDAIATAASITGASHVTLHYRMAVLVDGEERELVNTFEAAPATLQMEWGSGRPTSSST